MRKTNIEAPWYEFQKKVNVLFGQDPDIKVGEIYGPDDGSSSSFMTISQIMTATGAALRRILRGKCSRTARQGSISARHRLVRRKRREL